MNKPQSMGCTVSRRCYKKLCAREDDDTTGSTLKEAFKAITSCHVFSGLYFIFPSGSVVRVESQGCCMLSTMEQNAKRMYHGFPNDPSRYSFRTCRRWTCGRTPRLLLTGRCIQQGAEELPIAPPNERSENSKIQRVCYSDRSLYIERQAPYSERARSVYWARQNIGSCVGCPYSTLIDNWRIPPRETMNNRPSNLSYPTYVGQLCPYYATRFTFLRTLGRQEIFNSRGSLSVESPTFHEKYLWIAVRTSICRYRQTWRRPQFGSPPWSDLQIHESKGISLLVFI